MPHQKHVDILEGNQHFYRKVVLVHREWHSDGRLLSAPCGSYHVRSIGIYRK